MSPSPTAKEHNLFLKDSAINVPRIVIDGVPGPNKGNTTYKHTVWCRHILIFTYWSKPIIPAQLKIIQIVNRLGFNCPKWWVFSACHYLEWLNYIVINILRQLILVRKYCTFPTMEKLFLRRPRSCVASAFGFHNTDLLRGLLCDNYPNLMLVSLKYPQILFNEAVWNLASSLVWIKSFTDCPMSCTVNCCTSRVAGWVPGGQLLCTVECFIYVVQHWFCCWIALCLC